ncbi:MAG: VOC family protein [Deltaproteobacteria bacterium]|nr:VOC family protein [Deltaproteobacteria bacterium]
MTAIAIRGLDHVNLTVPRPVEAAARRFYGEILGLRELPKPVELRGRGGAWFTTGAVQVHVSLDDAPPGSRRHLCFTVADLGAARAGFLAAGVSIEEDEQPLPGWPRFYVRDPGGNRVEIAAPAAA